MLRTIFLCLVLAGCGGPVDKAVNVPGEERREARRDARQQPTPLPPVPFSYAAYPKVEDCLNAAALAGQPLGPCDRRRK